MKLMYFALYYNLDKTDYFMGGSACGEKKSFSFSSQTGSTYIVIFKSTN